MKKTKLIIVMIFAFIISFNVSAECSIDELSRLKNTATNIQFVYYPYEDNGNTKFNLIISNSKDFTFYNNFIQVDSNMYGENGEIRINGLNPGENYTFYFYSTSDNCFGNEVYRKTISLPKTNPYFNDPVCSGKEEFDLCSKWKEIAMSYDEFVEKVNSYQKQEKTEEKIEVIQEETLLDMLIEIYLKYYWLILGSIVVIGVTIIIILRRKDDLFK